MIRVMAGQAAAMHVARIRSAHTGRDGQRREYESRYLRRTYRDGAQVRHETLANLSGLPASMVDAIEAALKGTPLVPAGQAVTITASVPHGHVAAVHAMAVKLGLPAPLGPPSTRRAARSRSGSSPATPATPLPSPRSCRWCGTSSGWRRWSWPATGA